MIFEELRWLFEILIPLGASAMGWFVGRKQRNNRFLEELQSSVNLLAAKNAEQMEEILKLREEIVILRSENLEFKAQVDKLTNQLAGVKTITKTK